MRHLDGAFLLLSAHFIPLSTICESLQVFFQYAALKMIKIVKVLALATAAAAAPYPPDVAIPPSPLPTLTQSFGLGHKNGGNFQPNRSSSSIPHGPQPLAVGGVVTGGAAVTSINNHDGIGAGQDVYRTWSGPGTSQAGWPRKDQWVSFEDMFNNNKAIMFSSCSQYGVPNDSGMEVGALYDAIQQIATETKVDHRFILAVMIQESGGCVRVKTSGNGVRNPGLMQDHNGSGTCNSDITHTVQNPCPNSVVSNTRS